MTKPKAFWKGFVHGFGILSAAGSMDTDLPAVHKWSLKV